MPLSKVEIKHLFERIIFDDEKPKDWVQDVWGMSPTLGESAAKLWEVFEAMLESYPEDDLEALLNQFYQDLL
ncbi:MAG TPA: hypothetical protein IGS53_26120 [Leptolyngbyaceae cyanobacterium M33_DOE_097]|uniref:Uncharacterized protein n=1 Tax=Oscillatoriales cyanobacterium SpSt-418 TaxID=2282169 RepID=A0A7C3KHA2_9CYAN|nr:hypothetical protein [Leptolyngbyaceae cyanobacterium M33_DOE_097]